jgi:hypothetical protein
MFHPISILRLVLSRVVLPIIDRLSEPPIMRARVNAGSDRYFAERRVGDDPALDELFEPLDPR